MEKHRTWTALIAQSLFWAVLLTVLTVFVVGRPFTWTYLAGFFLAFVIGQVLRDWVRSKVQERRRAAENGEGAVMVERHTWPALLLEGLVATTLFMAFWVFLLVQPFSWGQATTVFVLYVLLRFGYQWIRSAVHERHRAAGG